MIVIATDAPLNPRNLDRLAMRAMMGLARTGSHASNGSGDYVIAFSTHADARKPRSSITPITIPTIGVVGESGSGKSTLGKAIINLLDYEGLIKFNGRSIKELNFSEKKSLKKDIQIVFQDPYGSLSPRMTIGEIIGEGLDIHFNYSNEEKLEKISNVMRDVGLDDSLIFKYPHEFSGGQRQRIAIARSIILNPKFMILDEPTSALDRSIQIQVIDVLKKLQDKYKLTYLFISHDLKVIRSMCDQIFVMSEGKLVEFGKADDVFENPQEDYTQRLLKAALKYSSN